MAFISTVTDVIEIANGYIMEYGTFSGAGVTTGTITAGNASTAYEQYATISDIREWGVASDGDTAVTVARDGAPNVVKITFTSADTGDYYIKGQSR
jgi:hypothetical protein